MERGDLSNVVAPRLLVVFEGLIGILPEKKTKEFSKHLAKRNWQSAVNCFELNDMALRRILYLTWKKNYNISVVTWLGEDAAIGIENLLSSQSIPVRNVLAYQPDELARLLPYNPDVVAVYDPVPEHVLTFGSKAILVTDPLQIGG